jgi:nudix-type nucleoside diphosphatase (YffH/AdpP family)
MINKINIRESKLLSDSWYRLRKYTFDYQKNNGEIETQKREVYDRGNGAAILLYNPAKKSVILTRQFRIPTFLNGNSDGMMIEVCAGVLDKSDPEACIIRETKEETGYAIPEAHKIFESYMSPGAVTEILHFFVAEYSDDMKVDEGGGLDEEHEHIEVLEMSFNEAYELFESGEIKDSKTIMLLQYAKINQLV